MNELSTTAPVHYTIDKVNLFRTELSSSCLDEEQGEKWREPDFGPACFLVEQSTTIIIIVFWFNLEVN